MENENFLKKLNLGCGEAKKDGYVNIDWQPIVKPDILHNLNVFPYPFSDNDFDLIEAFHILEHLDKPFLVMKELHRILKPGGILIIKVPHFSRGFTHVEHTHGLDVTFPLYFDKKYVQLGFSGYFGVEFEHQETKMQWSAFLKVLLPLGYNKFVVFILQIINNIFSFFANISPHFCSRVWCYWVGGFEEMTFKFRCKK